MWFLFKHYLYCCICCSMPDNLHLTSSDADRCVTLSQGDFYLATFTFFTTQAGGMLNWVKFVPSHQRHISCQRNGVMYLLYWRVIITVLLRVQYMSFCHHLRQLNIMLHDRKELSGQRSCNPAQVFGIERKTRNPLHLMDREFQRLSAPWGWRSGIFEVKESCFGDFGDLATAGEGHYGWVIADEYSLGADEYSLGT
ncbi:hypothetical protein RHSIM_Rhsim08G0136000 [Rhododendron simsii]|uniref:Uncharacterized protein n=1 Tax=Rhododendron simsii TaxID=118357 RepID=A0A834GJG1_RHOSS|nr:hypothetical protein RHSIM_Rhsim08G0136000 [Rhododendron simsii]